MLFALLFVLLLMVVLIPVAGYFSLLASRRQLDQEYALQRASAKPTRQFAAWLDDVKPRVLDFPSSEAKPRLADSCGADVVSLQTGRRRLKRF